jgi:hypothetical protein
MQVQLRLSSTALHGAPEELLDAATSNASIAMRPWFSSQCEILEHRRFGFISAHFLFASVIPPSVHATHSPLAIEVFLEAALYQALLRHV